ncbi:EscD/YscD/HrpQ family type III secretion system periplasmic domain-containing protein [Glacieibacterium frigidum]|uniref:Uncharacterized protein n=1 Tax=Glacieibacterium frigidum TaxID=2593303 RepID=A0A552UGN1_9SPHN|nr:hypothetical protein [Glacieibacterium frigidum]TRW17369.1 hypothetical protein FMM06_04125 [Glacieibacterium frigidum]
MSGSEDLVVRVLTGTRSGAEAGLPANGRATIGHEYWHDVVIREDATRGCALELNLGDDGVARLTVLEGSAVLLGSTLQAGDTAVLPPFVPVTIGGVAVAFGSAESDRWAEAGAIAGSRAPAEADPDAPASLAASWRDATKGRLGRSLRPKAIIGVVVLVALLLLVGPAIEALQIGGGPAERTERAITAAGYGAVKVREAQDGTLLLSGYVATDADRQRIRGLVEAKAMRATLAIETGEENARGVADVARVNGVEARARSIRAGVVELTTAPLTPEVRGKVTALIRRDVPSLRRLIYKDDPSMDRESEIKTIADATKRVSSVVAGDPAYIITADGARYFPGAVMPSGHRLVAIQEQTVVLERNGRQIRLKF